MKYLPSKFKDGIQSERASAATRRVAVKNSNHRMFSFELEDLPKDVVIIKAYGNTDFVNVMLKKQFYMELEEKSKKLKTTPEKLLYNAILIILKSLYLELPPLTARLRNSKL